MSVTICHLSDWHGELDQQLPEADLYLVTGDMLDNYPLPNWGGPNPFNLSSFRIIDPRRESKKQQEWIKSFNENKGEFGLYNFRGGLRSLMPESTRDNPVVVVRGNHDFTSLTPLIDGECFEIGLEPDRVVEYCGLKIGGFRGMPFYIGEWSDEKSDSYFDQIISGLPDQLDVIVTHCPPYGILDNNFHGIKIGIKAYGSYINKLMYTDPDRKLLCVFGHCHEDNGVKQINNITFSNAATTYRLLEYDT